MKKEFTKGEVLFVAQALRQVRDFGGMSKEHRIALVRNIVGFLDVEADINKEISKYLEIVRTPDFMDSMSELARLKELGDSISKNDKDRLEELITMEKQANESYSESAAALYKEPIEVDIRTIPEDELGFLLMSELNYQVKGEDGPIHISMQGLASIIKHLSTESCSA